MKNPFDFENSFTASSAKKNLEWEESAVDQGSEVEEVFDQSREVSSFFWLKFFSALFCLAMLFRLFQLQVLNGEKYRQLSENNRIRKQPILSPRGIIKDRYGKILTENTASFNLVAIPFDLAKSGSADLISKLSSVFGLDSIEVAKKIKQAPANSIVPLVLKQNLTADENILFQTRASEFIGFSVQQVPIRNYISPEVFSHVLGYSGVINSEDLKKYKDLYEPYDFIGKSGIEQQYESFLHGKNGSSLVEVDASGKLLDVLGEQKPEPGKTLVLNIDKELQERLYTDLQANLPNRRAAAVVLNPKNGQVLALISIPGFNNNLFSSGIKKDDYNELLNDKKLPLFNRAIAGTYPPGSTVKPVVAIAALEEKVVTKDTIIQDRGVLVIPNQFNSKVDYNFYGWKRDGLGAMNVQSAIAESSDIYFYTVVGGHPHSQIKGLGAEKLAEYYRKFNLGKSTQIDLQGEKSGLVPDPAWKLQYYKNDLIRQKWYLGDTYHIGIGQGDMLTTPLQVAQFTAIIANSGIGYKPQIVHQVLDKDGNVLVEKQPEILVDKLASLENIKIAQGGMRQTVLAGSGRLLNSLPISSAGKTGTSQFDGSNPLLTHAWFTVYAPFEDPQIVVTILVEAGGEGHAAAVPVAKEILKWWAENRYRK